MKKHIVLEAISIFQSWKFMVNLMEGLFYAFDKPENQHRPVGHNIVRNRLNK